VHKTVLSIRIIAQIVLNLLGGNSGERRRDVVIQIPDFRESKFILEENMIQAVTILILACIGNKL
jgi:hypothetical protein|tara:strand:- start:147 stop:341 length:195 start_codon:yes stop_codon:yes gene_type:complete